MHTHGTISPAEKKTIVLACVLFLASMFLPFLSLRPNRVAPQTLVGVLSLGLLPLTVLALPPVLILLAGERKWCYAFASLLGLGAPLFFLAMLGSSFTAEAGPFARFGPGAGFYLYLAAASILLIMRRRAGVFVSVGLAIILVAIVWSYTRGAFDRLGLVMEATQFGSRLPRELFAHMRITFISTMISTLVGLPLALLSFQHRRIRSIVYPFLNVLQTIPGIALFGLLIAPLAALSQAVPLLRSWGIKGIGNTPAIIALSTYALYPVIRYTVTTLTGIDHAVIQAAEGVGMSSRQVWSMVRLPLGAPGILHGIRVAMVQTIGNATLAKLVGGDGLGVLVFEGLGQSSVDMVLLGMVLIVMLTVGADRLLHLLIMILTPKPLRKNGTEEASMMRLNRRRTDEARKTARD